MNNEPAMNSEPTMENEFAVGDAVKIIDRMYGTDRLVCRGQVERLTATWVIVRNEHHNLSRFRRRDRRQVFYSWPHLTHELRKAE